MQGTCIILVYKQNTATYIYILLLPEEITLLLLGLICVVYKMILAVCKQSL